MAKIHLEALPALAEALGISGAAEEVLADRENLRDLLNRLGARYHRFGEIVFERDAQRLTGQVIVFLNGRNVELLDGLETRLTDGDTLTFIPFVEGG